MGSSRKVVYPDGRIRFERYSSAASNTFLQETGYIPTQRAFDENFDHDWRWVSKAAAKFMEEALQKLLAE